MTIVIMLILFCDVIIVFKAAEAKTLQGILLCTVSNVAKTSCYAEVRRRIYFK